MAMLPTMLEEDRKRAGWSVGQSAWRLGVSVREYRELEAGDRSPSFETWDRIQPRASASVGSRYQSRSAHRSILATHMLQTCRSIDGLDRGGNE
jgi:hypothetical protein